MLQSRTPHGMAAVMGRGLTGNLCCVGALALSLPCSSERCLSAQVDILLNNAGLALGTAPVQGTTSSDALGMITTNCSAVVRAAPHQHKALLAAHTSRALASFK